MEINLAQENWVSGELSEKMEGRSDLPVYKTGCKRMLNYISETTGPARFRNGTQFVNPVRRNQVGCLIPFQFSSQQALELEFTQGFIRFYENNQVVTLVSKTITGIAVAAGTGVMTVTSAAHGYSNGDEVILSGVHGMPWLEGQNFVIKNKATDTYQLASWKDGTTLVNGLAAGTYVSGGISNKIYEVASPYQTADLFQLKYAQNADTMYIVHRLYAPYKLVRIATTNWTLGTFTRIGDPFTGVGNYPGAIAFYQGRLIYGYTDTYPESIWGSKPLDTNGDPQYDDMTIGSAVTDGFKFTLSPITGKVDRIESLVPTLSFLAICTFEGISKCDGGTAGQAISPSNIDITPCVTVGVLQQITPILLGINMVFFHRSGLIMFSQEFDIFYSAYNAIDKNLQNEHITASGAVQMVYHTGRPSGFYFCRNDGVLIGVTYLTKENINGGYRFVFGGLNAKCLSVGNMPRENQFDQTWVIVERVINGETVRFVEYLNDEIAAPIIEDFYTGPLNQDADRMRWLNEMFEAQKQYVYMDASLTYDGGDYSTVEVTPSAVSGLGVTFTASSGVFTASMVGRQIWKKSSNGIGSGRAQITGYTSATQVTCNILTDFDTDDAMPIGGWYLTTDTIYGLWYLEGETVALLTDGGEHAAQVVTNGQITLQYQASVIHAGEYYIGLIQSMPVELPDGAKGSSEGKAKNINRLAMHFVNTLAVKFGSDLYRLQEADFRLATDMTGRPSPMYSGLQREFFEDTAELHKHIYIVQDRPLPCTIAGLAPFIDSDEE